jgi:hypothetical protein
MTREQLSDLLEAAEVAGIDLTIYGDSEREQLEGLKQIIEEELVSHRW